MTEKLVYGYDTGYESWAVGYLSELRDLASDVTALTACKTWGEVRRAKLSDSGPFQSWGEDDWAEYEADDDFDWQSDTPGIEDGDWPPMVTSLILGLYDEDYWAEIAADLDAELVSTVFNGEALSIPLGSKKKLVRLLTDSGFKVRRDDELISRVNPG